MFCLPDNQYKNSMKKIWILALLALISKASIAQYKPVDKGSTLQFTIQNLGFDVGGSFSGFDGTINFDPANLAGAEFDVSIDASKINTDNSFRDGHLRDESYFDVKKYPRIRFVSTKITPSGKNGTFTISGKLTIKNQTKDISFPFTAVPSNGAYVFKGTFKIKRKDFGVGGTSTISDELVVVLNVLTTKA